MTTFAAGSSSPRSRKGNGPGHWAAEQYPEFVDPKIELMIDVLPVIRCAIQMGVPNLGELRRRYDEIRSKVTSKVRSPCLRKTFDEHLSTNEYINGFVLPQLIKRLESLYGEEWNS